MRKTIDTNILVRALVDENDVQSRIAVQCLTGESVHVPVTVMLETEWVLRSSYGLGREIICSLLGSLLSLRNVEVDQRDSVGAAIAAHGAGFDFADALHLQSSKGSASFLTFDLRLRKLALKQGSPIPVEMPGMH